MPDVPQRAPRRTWNFDEPQENKSQGGFVVKLLTAIMVPILIAWGLWWGVEDTWNTVQQVIPGLGTGSAACEGFDEWNDDTNERAKRMLPLLESVGDVETADLDDVDALVNELHVLANEQRRSDPPLEAMTLNSLLTDYYGLFADTITARANLELTKWGEKSGELDVVADEAEEEAERVRKACE